MTLTEELRKVYEEAIDASLASNKKGLPFVEPVDAALLAVARYSAEKQRGMEPTEGMIENGAIAASAPADYRIDDVLPYSECDNVFRAEWRGEVTASYKAMQSAAPLWVDVPVEREV